ncbi:MAG: hypothetical protein AVDCRST_MAG90-214, partial [uncultured Microvirga sp.]
CKTSDWPRAAATRSRPSHKTVRKSRPEMRKRRPRPFREA